MLDFEVTWLWLCLKGENKNMRVLGCWVRRGSVLLSRYTGYSKEAGMRAEQKVFVKFEAPNHMPYNPSPVQIQFRSVTLH